MFNLDKAAKLLEELECEYLLAEDGTYVLQPKGGVEVHGMLPKNEEDYSQHLEIQLNAKRSGAW